VSDVVRANLLGAAADLTGAVNIGTGRETSVLDLLEALREVSDRRLVEPQFARERPGEVRRSCLAVERANRKLGWVAQTKLRDGLDKILSGLQRVDGERYLQH
jgi:UDP-glucose 4-epimerase